MNRCKWCNLKNPKYIKYHDEEWGVPNFDDRYLYEMLVLESFHAGLSWECILNKREAAVGIIYSHEKDCYLYEQQATN